MSKMSPHRTAKSSRNNRWRQPALSLHVLPDQVYAPTEGLGLSRRNAEEGAAVVRGWDEPTADRPSSGGTSSHGLAVSSSPSCPTVRSARPQRSQRSRVGRVVHLHWGQKKPNLRPHNRRPPHPLLSGLQSSLAANPRSDPGDGRRSPEGQALLQRRF